MKYRLAAILGVGILLGGLLVACNSKREPDLLPAAHAEAVESAGQSPPGLKVGARVEFVAVANHPFNGVLNYETPIVDEIRGNWVLMRCTVKKEPDKEAPKDIVVWVNFNNVVYFQTK